jgi:hypothetical protein
MDLIRKWSAVALAVAVFLPQYSCDTGSNARVYYAYEHDELWWAVVSVLMYVAPLAVAFIPNVRWSALLGIITVGTTLYFRSYQVIVVATTLYVGWWVGTIAAILYAIACVGLLVHHLRS